MAKLPVIKIVPHHVAKHLGVHPDTDFDVVSRLAGKKLREMGYTSKYHHGAWERGRKWFAPNSDVPHSQTSPVHVLGDHLNSQHSESETPHGHVTEERARQIINEKYGNK